MVMVYDANLGSVHQVSGITSHTADPTATSDTNSGYQVGDTWFNSTSGVFFVCTVNTAGAAVWVQDAGGFVRGTYATGLTAVGTNRGNSLALTAQTNHVGTAASSAVGVVLPASALIGVGGICRVINDGPSNAFHVYAAGSDTIDGTAGSTGVNLTNAFFCDYQVDAAGAFISYRQAVTRSA